MYYQLEKLNPRQFEILAANYAKDVAPEYKWSLTKSTIDFNRDFEATFDDNNKWGEAKHTQKSTTSVSKNRWDPTLVSAVLKNDVDEIYLVTSGWIPLEYIVRAEHFRRNNIKKILYVNRYLLDEWLKNTSFNFDNFGETNIDIIKILQKIKSTQYHTAIKDSCIINIFSPISNILEPLKNVEKTVIYEINITIFSTKDSCLLLELPDHFRVTETKHAGLSPIILDELHSKQHTRAFGNTKKQYQIRKGYSQILVYGFFDLAAEEKATIKVDLDRSIIRKTIQVKKRFELTKKRTSNIAIAENTFNTCLSNNQNLIIKTQFLDKHDLTRCTSCDRRGEYNYFRFGKSICKNAIITCRIIAKLLLGIDYVLSNETTSEKTINNSFELCPFWLSSIFVGTTNHIFALNSLQYIAKNKSVFYSFAQKMKLPFGSIIFIDNYDTLHTEQKEILTMLFEHFTSTNNSSMIVINSTQILSETTTNQCFDNKEFPQEFDYSNTNTQHQLEMDMIDSLWLKSVFSNDDIEKLLSAGDFYYEKTDFFKALFFYSLINRKTNNNDDINMSKEYIFKYADCLNHCGSMKESQQQFERIIEIGDEKNSNELKMILEAQTEIFSLKFWRLDISNIVESIDELLVKYNSQLYADNGSKRDKYAFYNCLNRKMVALYLKGDYAQAEITFETYVNSIDSRYNNYLAFAYMDSARGLYAHNIKLAKERMQKAFSILKVLYLNGEECRRYFDCLVELEYINFVVEYESGKSSDTEPLEYAVFNVRNNGYKSMLVKCYLKLATCYLALEELDRAFKYLSYVKLNCDFEDDVRTAVLYNKILSNFYDIKNTLIIPSNELSKDFVHKKKISFNCSTDGEIRLETRIW